MFFEKISPFITEFAPNKMLVRKAEINKVDFDLLCMYEYDTHVGLSFKGPPMSKLLHNIEYQALYIIEYQAKCKKDI